ncbi:MAG: ABC transporter ATP-binding protein, partial [Clostridiales bacterium]|nr:ABC transporter ATP-binding protein [Clostridiales bacterium]
HYLKSLKNQGITIIITTHVMDEVNECDNAALLRGGKILIADSVSNLIAKSPDGKIEDLFFLENKEESLCFQ